MHMVVALKYGSVKGLNESNFMPLWWMISLMHLQYPVDTKIKVDMDIASLILDGVADHHIHYCLAGGGRMRGALKNRSKKRSR